MATLTVRQSGGDYSSLSAALSAANASDTISIENTWTVDDTSAATISDDNLTIQTDSSSKHPGYYDESTNHYRLVQTGGSHALTLNGAYTVTLDGVAIVQGTTGAGGTSDECFRCTPSSGDTVTIKNCIFYITSSQDQQDCIYTGFNQTIGTITIENSMIMGAYRAGVHAQNFYSATHSGTLNINSCTLWNNGRDPSPGNVGEVGGGVKAHGNDSSANGSGFNINVHNTLSLENDSGGTASGAYTHAPADFNEYINGGTGCVWGISYSIDSDNTITSRDSGGTGNLASRTATDNTSPGAGDWVIFEDITTADYDLRVVDNAENDAQDAHSTATAESLTIPSTDIVGTSRPQNTNYEIGAFEIVDAGAPAAGAIMTTNKGIW